ncbi:type II secretion system protein [Burkholderia cepacia]|uniref:type II secretion system protein n=1 Tax=Burkholderia cepacia TaxID=292 RepID=UPI001589406C|nr:hypothetical protein [Burkholderia cepacia]
MHMLAYRYHQRGFGLLEAALSMALAGLFAVGFWTLTRTTQQQSAAVHRHELLARADLSLVSYVFEHGRLPCPATDTSGTAQASCAPGVVGKLPYRDLGLPEMETGTIQYTVQGYPQVNQAQQVNLTVDNTGLLQILVGQTSLHPTPALVDPRNAPIAVAHTPFVAICAVLTAPMEAGSSLAPVYTLQLKTQAIGNDHAADNADQKMLASDPAGSNRGNSGSQNDILNQNSRDDSPVHAQSRLAFPQSDVRAMKVAFRSDGGASSAIALASTGTNTTRDVALLRSAPSSADTTQVLNHSFAELSTDLGCPAMMSTGTRAMFNGWLSAQVLLAGLNDYQALLQVLQDSAIADLSNGAAPLAVIGPAKVGAKVMNLLNANGEYTKKTIENPLVAADFTDVGYAIADLVTESIYEAMNGVKMVRFAMNEINSASFNYQLSQQYMATLAIQIDLLRQHAVSSLADGVYL